MELGDKVTWEATHFAVKQRLTIKITEYDSPVYFQDCQTNGIFKSFKHDHHFEEQGQKTIITDKIIFECPMGILGKVAGPFVFFHLKNFVAKRNRAIKKVAESKEYLEFVSSE